MNAPIFLPVIAGPTASGKTALAISLAQRLGGEVVSADSMQVYKDLFIGVARPSLDEMQGVPHHLLGFLPLTEKYSVARYTQDAHRTIAAIHERGRIPLLSGGTGLYIDAVVDNLRFQGGGENPALRESLRRRAQEQGGEALLEELRRVDEETAAHLHPNNIGRIIRALELVYVTGMTMSEQNKQSRSQPSPYRARILVLGCRNREYLYHRIHRRVEEMLEKGLLEEARAILSAPTAPTAMQAIGYKELAPYVEGTLSLSEAVDNLKQATRRYAKRQLSWFRRRRDAHWLMIDDYPDIADLTDAAAAVLKE